MFWDEAVETLEPGVLRELQLQRLNALLARLKAHVPHYRDALAGTGPVSALEELASLPFTTKADLREHYPFDLLTVPRERVVRIHASSGTTGKPTVVAYSASDMKLWAEVMARVLVAGGVTARDTVHNAYGYGLFTGGLGFGLGAETVGAATVPVSGGNTDRQVMLLRDFEATVLCATPSYGLVLAEALAADDEARSRLKLRVGFFGAEPWTSGVRDELEAKLGLTALDTYGLSEIIGPGVAAECFERGGLHLAEDHFLPEVVAPDTGAPLPDGEEGELVLTTLTKEAMPLLRYRTRDRVRLARGPCACGRTFARMSSVLGRTDDMLIVRGVNVFPSQVETALLGVEGLTPHYVIYLDRRPDRLDTMEIKIEREPSVPAATEGTLAEGAARRVQSALGIRVRLRVVAPGSVPRSQGKAVRVIDRRSQERR